MLGRRKTQEIRLIGIIYEYSEKKYQMFLDELKKDDIVFDGKNKQVLRKYSLRLKNTLKQMNAGKDMEDWVKDENDNVITVEVAG